jgi:S1-C subfamily serine protease
MPAEKSTDKNDLEGRVRKLEDEIKRPQKDFWDKLDAGSSIVAGIIVAVIGFYATNVYDSRSKELDRLDRSRNVVAIELQTVEKFFPHLSSKDETEKQAAIEAISSIANAELAAKIAAVFRGPGARAALTNIGAAAPAGSKAADSVQSTLTDLFRAYKESVGGVYLERKDEPTGQAARLEGTCVVVSSEGYALTAAHLFSGVNNNASVQMSVSLGSRSSTKHSATLISLEPDSDLALIKINAAMPLPAVKFGNEQLLQGAAVSIMGFQVGLDLLVRAAVVGATSATDGRIVLDAQLGPGASGSPVFNSSGDVIAIVIAGSINQNLTFAIPIRRARQLLVKAGV